jgi:hypothetical protein
VVSFLHAPPRSSWSETPTSIPCPRKCFIMSERASPNFMVIYMYSTPAILEWKCKLKATLYLCLTSKTLCRKDVWGSGVIISLFLASPLDRNELSASRHGRFILGERAPVYVLDERLVRPQSRLTLYILYMCVK